MGPSEYLLLESKAGHILGWTRHTPPQLATCLYVSQGIPNPIYGVTHPKCIKRIMT